MVPLAEARTASSTTADLTGVIRARRRQVWRRRLIAIGIVAALLALAAIAWFTPLLALEKVAVSGSRLVDEQAVTDSVMDSHGGTPLPQVRPGEVEDAVLGRFEKAEAASVHYAGPRALKIEITDRTPVLAIAGPEGFDLFDADAVDLGTVDEAPKDLTVLEDSGGDPDEATVDAVIRFMAGLRPELRTTLVTIEAEDATSLRGVVDTGEHRATVDFGSAENASLKMRTAAQLAADGRTEIDVSVPSVPVTN